MLQLFNIKKSYTTADFTQTALDDVSISFRDNEFVAILGPSGSGKTTMLNIVGGLDHYDSGNLVIDGISTEEYKDRDWDTYRNNRIGFVFQSYNLIPHQSVLANVELALTLSGVSRSERRERAKQALEQVGLVDHINKKPNQLSGGQMQRVAVARALINDPEILLADEPTGALDSTTSVQIMELLTEIAKDRLVIMVTHNPELADQYATRIVNLRDGKVTDDTDPFEPTPEELKMSDKSVRRTKMSYLTAIALSFNNLMTKKGRTLMTAFAGSIGIIGIAAILALANGVNNYIKSVEEETLSVYPLTIESTGFNMLSMMTGSASDPDDSDSEEVPGSREEETQQAGGDVHESKTLAALFSSIGNNDLKSLKEYLESGESDIDEYANMITYNYNITPQIFSPDTTESVYQVNPNTAFNALSNGMMSGMVGEYASMATSGSNANVFLPMLDNPSILEAQYNVVEGRWPENYDELILVLNRSGGINDAVLYAMGLRDRNELDAIVNDVANNEEAIIPEEQLDFSYEELMDVSFKLVNSADMYQKDEEYHVWKDKREDTEFMRAAVNNGEDLKIVGIVQIDPDAAASSLSPGLCYTSGLQLHLIEEAAKKPIVAEQQAQPELNVISGRTFQDERENPDNSSLDFSSMISVDSNAIANAFTFDASALQIDPSGFSNLNFDPSKVGAMPQLDLAAAFKDLDVDIPPADINALITDVMSDFYPYYTKNSDPTKSPANEISRLFPLYLNTPGAQTIIQKHLTSINKSTGIVDEAQAALQKYLQTSMQSYLGKVMTSMTQQIRSAMSTTMAQLSNNMAGAMGIDEQAFANAFQFNMDENDLRELMMSLMSRTETTYDSNLSQFGYVDTNKPSSIDIYPIDFASKEKIIDILDNYNDRMKAEDEDKVIVYTDIVGTLMSSVTTIVDMISYVLIAFVAISLVVSSIMIGIITYISVLERKKEIGILRSIGASKKDISHVFNAETLIVGLVAGLIGVGITSLICIPANIIIETNFAVKDVASLPWEAAIILVFISCFLSFIAGLIPSSAASRKDPVEALRSE